MMEPALTEGPWAPAPFVSSNQESAAASPQYQPPPSCSPQPPHTTSSIPELSSGALRDGPCQRWRCPGAPRPPCSPRKAAALLPSLSLTHHPSSHVPPDRGKGQGPAQPRSCPGAEGAPRFHVGESGPSTGRERKNKKRSTFGKCFELGYILVLGTGRGRTWVLGSAQHSAGSGWGGEGSQSPDSQRG